MKDLQGIVGDENTGEEIENSGELRVEILLQVKVQVMQGPLNPFVIAPSALAYLFNVCKYALVYKCLRSIRMLFHTGATNGATAKFSMCKMQELSPLRFVIFFFINEVVHRCKNSITCHV